MTQSIDNSEWVMPGVIRDPITGALMRVNADGSINVSITGGGGGAGTGFTSASTAGTALAGTLSTNGLSLGVPAWLTAAAGGGAGTGFTSTTTAGTAMVGTLSTNGLSIGVPAFITTGRASTDGLGLNTAGTNITWTANSSGVSINAAGYAGTGVTIGSTVGTVAVATLNSNGLSFLNPEPYISSYEPFAIWATSNFVGMNGASQSYAVPFVLPQAGSFSFIRLPVSMTTNSTTLATTGATMSASAAAYSTWNAVAYALGTGASSRSLVSVASGSAGFTTINSISVAANGTQASYTQQFIYQAEGSQATSSAQYSVSNTNYSFVSTAVTDQTGARMLDINFANSLSAGPYWLIIGYSSSSATNSTGVGGAVNMNSFSFNYMATTPVPTIRAFSGNNTVALYGSFSTAGGGTTSILPVANISTVGNNPRMYFQFLRSA